MPCGVHPCCEEGLQLSLEAELLMRWLLGLGLPADSQSPRQTQAAAESPEASGRFSVCCSAHT